MVDCAKKKGTDSKAHSLFSLQKLCCYEIGECWSVVSW